MEGHEVEEKKEEKQEERPHYVLEVQSMRHVIRFKPKEQKEEDKDNGENGS